MASDQCAVGADGKLLPAAQINFFNDPDDMVPISGPDAPTGRGHRVKSIGRMKASIQAEQNVDNEGNLIVKRARQPRHSQKGTARASRTASVASTPAPMDIDTDCSDSDFAGDPSDDDTEDGSMGNISNGELADSLPTKFVPEISKAKTRSKAALRAAAKSKPTKRAATDNDSAIPPKNRRMSQTDPDLTDGKVPEALKTKKRNPIYHFYTDITTTMEGQAVAGSRYYKCCHTGKICQITAKMNYSLTGLINHLRNNVPPMYQLYEILKARLPALPTEEEISIASGTKKLGYEGMAKYLQGLSKSDGSIAAAFAAQVEKAKGPFDQKEFERLLVEWIIACDQPFEEVERPQLRRLLEYTHHSIKPLHVPHRTTIKTRIMKMGEDKVEDIKRMFSELKGKVSISLDAWTSSNHYAFLAIVAHYVTNDGHLQELLIGFRELHGEHSGENLAEVVWDTLLTFGVLKKVNRIITDHVLEF